jgi:hypothetical protein
MPGRGRTWANGRTSQTSTSAPELPGEAAGVPSAVVPCAPSPRHRPPALRSFVRADADATELPPAVSLSNRDDGDGPVVGDNGAQIIVPTFPFSRLISRSDCAQLRTGSDDRQGSGSSLECAQWARSWHVKEAAKEGKGWRCRAHDRHLIQPTSTVHQPLSCAQLCALPPPARRGSRSLGCAAVRTFRPDQEAKLLVLILRTNSAQIGLPSAPSLMARSAAKKMDWRVMRAEGKVKGTKVRFS